MRYLIPGETISPYSLLYLAARIEYLDMYVQIGLPIEFTELVEGHKGKQISMEWRRNTGAVKGVSEATAQEVLNGGG